jgi:bleomycin hydrolase
MAMTDSNTITRKRMRNENNTQNDDLIKTASLQRFKNKFNENSTNKLIQNALCSNSLYNVAEVREYMQSHDNDFSHTLDPELEISNQGLSGRCWMFAVLNVMRHELVRKLDLTREFELSESYICFYEKLEKCNYFLSEFMDKDNIDLKSPRIRSLLCNGCEDGGLWVTCANLIKKYGIIPKTCYHESVNSSSTSILISTINYKLKEFAVLLTSEKDKTKRVQMKEQMMEQIYDILCKMLGTPPNPNEKFNWSFTLHVDITKQLEREKKRRKKGQYENLQIKTTHSITPLEFYEKFIVNKFDDYIKLGNDPRNKYEKYYQSFNKDVVLEGERNGHYNVNMDVISELCIKSIIDNTPVEFDCDVGKFLNPTEELFDDKCYDYSLVFGQNFYDMPKKKMMECMESYANHAMVLVGVDLDKDGRPLKWKVENSWGRDDETTGYYTMSHDWFQKYVYNAVVQRKYVPIEMLKKYDTSIKKPITLPEFDIM